MNRDSYRECAAAQYLLTHLDHAMEAQQSIRHLHDQLTDQTNTHLFDWVDHLVITYSDRERDRLAEAGFVEQEHTQEGRLYAHPTLQLPRLIMRGRRGPHLTGVAISAESIAHFLMIRGKTATIEGLPFAPYRRCCIAIENGMALWVVERRGGHYLIPPHSNEGFVSRYLEALERWQTRPRDWEDETMALNQALIRAREICATVGRELAAAIVLTSERAFWQIKNHAAQAQKNRQDRLGVGWGNVGHYSFHSSRPLFPRLIELFEILGFVCQERRVQEEGSNQRPQEEGEEALWEGTQVMKHPHLDAVLTLCVDLTQQEAQEDFAHRSLPLGPKLGTSGLWCALHGESITSGGALEISIRGEEALKETLAAQGATLEQQWPVSQARLRKLLRSHLVSHDQAEHFLHQGAKGSHLGVIQGPL